MEVPQGHLFLKSGDSGTKGAAVLELLSPLLYAMDMTMPCSPLCRMGSSPPCLMLGMGWGTSWLGCWLISSWPGECLAQQPSGSSSQHLVRTSFHLPSSLSNTLVWPVVKHTPFSSQGMLLPAAFLMAVPYVGCSSMVVVVLLTLALTIISMTGAGININHIDIAPR